MTDLKVSIRPVLQTIAAIENKSREEKFQNLTLRPVIKLQHELLIVFFENYLSRKKIDLTGLSTIKKSDLVSNIFKKDALFKIEVRGLIIGHFTRDEFMTYQAMSAEMNKRILAMVKERLLSVVL